MSSLHFAGKQVSCQSGDEKIDFKSGDIQIGGQFTYMISNRGTVYLYGFFFTMANRMALDALRRREVQGRFLREPARRH